MLSVTECDVEIHLADDSTLSSKKQYLRFESWMKDQGCETVNLSKTLIMPHLSTSLLPVPELARNNIAVLFM